MSKYYLVSYSYSKGFGNIYFESRGHLDIALAQEMIKERIKDTQTAIICINNIHKSQYQPTSTISKTGDK